MGKRTWGDIKLATLQLMFANEGVAINKDDNTEEYLNAMPMAANQALGEIFITGMPLLRRAVIRMEEGAEQTRLADGTLVLPTGGKVGVEMKAYWEDFRAIEEDEVWHLTNGAMERSCDFDLMGDGWLILDTAAAGEWHVWYRAYPQTIRLDTAEDTVLEMPEEAADIMPLYMAGELYKDDDLTAAIQFLNEFQQKLMMLQLSAQQKKPSASVGRIKNTTGWW